MTSFVEADFLDKYYNVGVYIYMEIVIRKQFVKWTWRITQLIKNQLADITIELWDELEIEPVHSFIYLLEGEEYALWGTDDTYIDVIVEREIKKLI